MRWKAHFYNEKKDVTQTISEIYSVKSLNCPPQVK